MSQKQPRGGGHLLADRARYRLVSSYNIARPFLMPPLAIAGVYAAVDFLQVYPWHHLMFYWVGAVALAGWAALELVRDVRSRWVVRRWLALEDPRAAQQQLDKVKPLVRRLPPWWVERYLQKKKELRDAS